MKVWRYGGVRYGGVGVWRYGGVGYGGMGV